MPTVCQRSTFGHKRPFEPTAESGRCWRPLGDQRPIPARCEPLSFSAPSEPASVQSRSEGLGHRRRHETQPPTTPTRICASTADRRGMRAGASRPIDCDTQGRGARCCSLAGSSATRDVMRVPGFRSWVVMVLLQSPGARLASMEHAERPLANASVSTSRCSGGSTQTGECTLNERRQGRISQ